MAQSFLRERTERRLPMKSLMISGFAALAMLAVATTLLWSQSPAGGRTVGSAMSLRGFSPASNVSKLPNEEFEDLSLVYSKKAE
jgi:hypothetical protein